MRLKWDQVGERTYEYGVNRGVLYIPNAGGNYVNGYAWNGLTTVTESPSGAEASPKYADNIKYLNLISAEEFGATIEALTYPREFGQCDGTASPQDGIYVGQQGRKMFGFSYQTRKGNDIDGTDFGYKIHLVWGALAAPSEKAYETINDSPDAITFSWEVTTTPVDVPGTNPLTGKPFKPTSTMTIDSTEVDADALADLEDILYGTESEDPRLPLPGEVMAIFSGTVTEVTPGAPTYNATTDIVTIPATAGVIYSVEGIDVPAGPYGPITDDVVVNSRPAPGNKFPDAVQDEWFFNFS